MPQRGREAEAEAAQPGQIEAGAAVRGRLQAEVELARVRELLGGAEAGDVEGALWEALQKILDTLESEAAPRS